jgi:predicted RNA-binding protein with TRAM domain
VYEAGRVHHAGVFPALESETQQPIEKGKTYDVDENAVEEGATKIECKMKRVVFVDGTSWSPN